MSDSSKKIKVALTIFYIILALVFIGYVAKRIFISHILSNLTPPSQVVSAAEAKFENWQPYLYSVGTLSAINGVDISAETAGHVRAIYFNSGKFVKQGEPLIQLDDSSEQAQLKDISAQLHLAQVNDKRIKQLYQQGAASQSNVDDSNTKVKQLLANYENARSLIAKKLIRAPFSGKIGIKQVNIGQYIAAGFACASLQTANALYAQFTLPQQDATKIKVNQEAILTVDAYPGQIFTGKITAIDSKIDVATRTIQAQATIENLENKLLPGMFVSIKVLLPIIPNSIVLPETAITYSLYGDSAFKVTLDKEKTKDGELQGTVKRVFVKSGEKRDNKVVILEGINVSDLVVSSGQLKLFDGSKIIINNSVNL
ncbi:MAG: efflux RND transporter periplasmic adaptor subunit [Spirobacillus cienkowskii]|jgi:membrane fusion protein (multidrug efflux system)|uniref:Efflux RND transporter periplasmic adaptor subunit n=1 Tax=Spirobacillus cienkowskii TaxID=495820 RepID=A0A369KXF0_9BACT|nr:MAG: efflux RND transporter periplasmic adaptor subunit [Spirobacillus cienkowskii]